MFDSSDYYQDPKLIYPIDLAFQDYISQCKLLIEKNRLDLKIRDKDQVIEANAPFELPPTPNDDSIGVLLVHGLYDSPVSVKDIGLQLQSEGILARSVLLPGHGIVPGALLHVHYEEWIKTVEYGIKSLAEKVNKIFLLGFSTGGSLCLYHALQKTHPKISGLIMIAPALKIKSNFDFMSNWHRTISWGWKRAEWLRVTDEIDYARYRSINFNSVYQVYTLANQLKTMIPQTGLTTPVFLIVANNDEIISTAACQDFFNRYANHQSKLLIYTPTPDANNTDPRVMYRSTHYETLRISNFSHLSLPISPNNYHYGQSGDYIHASILTKKDCYFSDLAPWQEYWNKLLFALKLTKYKRERLTYNPDFNFLIDQIKLFIRT